jgi:hypothetical protein
MVYYSKDRGGCQVQAVLEVAQGARLARIRYEGCYAMGGGERGKVLGFSAASKGRLLDFLNSQPDCAPYAWVCLTYGDAWAVDGREIGKHLHVLSKRLLRRYPVSYWVWRIEWEVRKSGAHVGEWYPHVHVLGYRAFVGDSQELYSLRCWLWDAWQEIVGHRFRVDVESVGDVRDITGYLTKYMAKDGHGEGPPVVGRVWGVWGRKNVPDNLVSVPVDAGVGYSYRRQLNNYVGSCVRRGKYPRKRRPLRRYQGVRAYLSDDSAWRLLALVIDGEGVIDCEATNEGSGG